RGYETAVSKRKRGEVGFPIEQLVRDAELYRIGEGATDILVPFIAREAWSPHLARVKNALGIGFLGFKSAGAALNASVPYARWYLGRLLPRRSSGGNGHADSWAEHRRAYVAQRSRVLARVSLQAMAVHRTGLERKQIIVDRLAAEGMDLFMMCATTAYAEYLSEKRGRPAARDLADHFFNDAQRWIAHRNFRYASRITECVGDDAALALGRQALIGDLDWLAEGALGRDY
ncbi:MAG TPA: hypothetical protein VGK54_00190, partial [Chloroflexota bacterium]